MHYTEACNEFAEPSPRHCTRATQLLLQKCHSSGEPSATLRPIRQARDLNLRSTAPETNALPLDQQAGKLTILSFFFHDLFVLKYAHSSNQHHIFLHRLLVLLICPIKLVKYTWPQKNLRNKRKLFYCNPLFLLETVSRLLNKESMLWAKIEQKKKDSIIQYNYHLLS